MVAAPFAAESHGRFARSKAPVRGCRANENCSEPPCTPIERGATGSSCFREAAGESMMMFYRGRAGGDAIDGAAGEVQRDVRRRADEAAEASRAPIPERSGSLRLHPIGLEPLFYSCLAVLFASSSKMAPQDPLRATISARHETQVMALRPFLKVLGTVADQPSIRGRGRPTCQCGG